MAVRQTAESLGTSLDRTCGLVDQLKADMTAAIAATAGSLENSMKQIAADDEILRRDLGEMLQKHVSDSRQCLLDALQEELGDQFKQDLSDAWEYMLEVRLKAQKDELLGEIRETIVAASEGQKVREERLITLMAALHADVMDAASPRHESHEPSPTTMVSTEETALLRFAQDDD